jgi:hypothetical protein
MTLDWVDERLALTREAAADRLSMSLESFERYVQPEVRMVRCGRLRLVAVSELEAWLVEHSERVL